MKFLTNIIGKDLLRFFIIIIPFFLIYEYFEPAFIKIPVVVNILDFLTLHILNLTSWALSTIFNISNTIENDMVVLPNGQQLQMQFGCSGLQQFILTFFLLVLLPGPWKHKLWFIPVSLIVIHFFNVVRFIGIALQLSHTSNHFHFIHDWVFRPFIYLIIFLVWVAWVELIAKSIKKPPHNG
ncbi:MAG: exosortase/archaeosortase family protein [Bacteroidales bacterium]|nr:exosortase/archaeosortase family protein [Bacteroidales bacterium]